MKDREFSRESTHIVKGVAILFLLQYHLFGDGVTVADLQVDYRPFPLDGFLTFSRFGNVSVAVFVFLTAYGITRGLAVQEEATARDMCRQALWRMLRLMANFARCLPASLCSGCTGLTLRPCTARGSRDSSICWPMGQGLPRYWTPLP